MSDPLAPPGRARRLFRHATELARAVTLPALGLLTVTALGALIWLGVRSPDASGDTRDFLPLLQDQATGALSVILVGLVAAMYFRLRYAQAKREYLKPFLSMPDRLAASSADGQLSPLAEAVDPLVKLRPPRPLLVVSRPDTTPVDIVDTFSAGLVQRGLTPVVVDASGLPSDADIPGLARSSFVARVAAATGDEPQAHRLFERELQRGRVVMLVTGLDQLDEAKPRAVRRESITALLRRCLIQGTPFIAAVRSELMPALSGVAVIRTETHEPPENLCSVVVSRLRRQGLGVTAALEKVVKQVLGEDPVGDPWLLTIAAEVVIGRVRNGEEPEDAVRDVLISSPRLTTKMEWLCEHALNVPLSGVVDCRTPAAEALALLGRQAHHREEFTTRWQDVTQDMDRDSVLRFSAGVASLSRKGILAETGNAGDPLLLFTHREWLVLAGALGMGVDGQQWTNLLSPGAPPATLEALVEALVLPRADERLLDKPILDVLSELRGGDLQDVSLDMITSVVAAVQTFRPLHVHEEELRILAGAWRVASDASRLLFLNTIEPNASLAMFLWEQVVPPQFHANSFRVRRAIALSLAQMGPTAWEALAPRWAALVEVARDSDLSPMSRITPLWQEVGVPLASLSWTLPTLVTNLSGPVSEEGQRLLGRAMGAALGFDVADGALPDPGLEISLAEGFKMASVVAVRRAHAQPPPWRAEATDLLANARSWVSRQVLQQGMALCGWDEPGSSRTGIREHPFVREAVSLARRTSAQRTRSHPQREIWLDDVEALQDGGFSLSQEAHRLLALSTLLINLCEGMAARAVKGLGEGTSDDGEIRKWEEDLRARVKALTTRQLPRCFTSPRHTKNLTKGTCKCEFGLCGRATPGSDGHRKFSRAFAERAQRTAGARRALGRQRAFVRRRFAEVWRHIWERIPVEESPGAWNQ
jgi:hypothetical protein